MNIRHLARLVILAMLAEAAAPTVASAAITTFFGEDTNGGAITVTRPNADLARTQFLASLTVFGTQSFERVAVGGPAGTFGFNNAALGTATATGDATVLNTPLGDAFATTGTNYIYTNGALSLLFSAAVNGFGLYVTDFGDGSGIGGPLSLTVISTAGTTQTLSVGNQVGLLTNGSALFFGFSDAAQTFSSVTFNGFGGTLDDAAGLDDLTIGTIAAATAGVPEPATWAMMMLGFGGMGYAMRRHPKTSTRVRFV